MSAFFKGSKAGGTDEQWEQIQEHLIMDQTLDADEMADKLFDWLGTVDLDAIGTDDEATLDRMLAELDTADSSEEEIDVQKSLEKVRRDYERMVDLVKADDQRSAAPAKRPRSALRKLFPLVAVLLLILGLMVTVQSDVADKIGHWTNEIFHFEDDADVSRAVITKCPLEEGEQAVYASLQEAMEAFGVEAPILPNWVPERFGEPEVTAEYVSAGIRIRANYEFDDQVLRISYNESEGIDYSVIEKDYPDADIYSKDIDHYIVTDAGFAKAIWWNGELECRISGDVTKTEMVDIIISLYEEYYEK